MLGVLGALVAAAALLDGTGSTAAQPTVTATVGPAAAPAGALSSSWFCAGATDVGGSPPGGHLPAAVAVVNSRPVPVSATVRTVGSSGSSSQVTVTVPPRSRQVVAEEVPGGSPWVGAMVDVDGGGASVEQLINSPLGGSAQPCATTGSRQWYFPSGATRVNRSLELTLLNPYPTEAIVDLSFVTDEGQEQPQEFVGLAVPARGLLAVDLGSHLRRRTAIATVVHARTGRVVAWESDVVTPPPAGAPLLGTPAASAPGADPADPVPGEAVTLGASSAGTTWWWPDGITGSGVAEHYVVFNPGKKAAQVTLSVLLAQGSAEPFHLSIGPGQVATVDAGTAARIPAGVAHAAVLRSTNGVPVVADRTLVASAPSNRRGRGAMLGGRAPATQWLMAGSFPGLAVDQYVVVFNPGRVPARVSLDALDGGPMHPLPGDAGLSVAPGQRLSIEVGGTQARPAGPLELQATAGVVVEDDLYGAAGRPGVSLGPAVPVTPTVP